LCREYLDLKAEIDELRDKQAELRKKRDVRNFNYSTALCSQPSWLGLLQRRRWHKTTGDFSERKAG